MTRARILLRRAATAVLVLAALFGVLAFAWVIRLVFHLGQVH